MSRTRKTEAEASAIGQQLLALRCKLGATLEEAALRTDVNVGQLSRFENGSFKFVSPNLQAYANFLQLDLTKSPKAPSLEKRFEAARKKSERHAAAAAAFVAALESLR